jgi:hypothetical protein
MTSHSPQIGGLGHPQTLRTCTRISACCCTNTSRPNRWIRRWPSNVCHFERTWKDLDDLRKKKSEDPWDTSNMLKSIDGPQKIHLRCGVNMYPGSCRNTAEDISMDEDQATPWDNPDQASLSSTGVVRTTIYHCFPTHCTVYVTCMERLFFCFDPIHELLGDGHTILSWFIHTKWGPPGAVSWFRTTAYFCPRLGLWWINLRLDGFL